MAKKSLGTVALALLPLLGACATQPPMAVPSPAPSVQASETATPTPSPTITPEPTPTPTPSTVAPTATPKPSPSVTPTPSATKTTAPASPKPSAKPSTVAPKPTTKPSTTTITDECASKDVAFNAKGDCVKQGLAALKAAGYYSPSVGTSFGSSAANWTVHYQRSRGLNPTGKIDGPTWAALRANQPAVPEVVAGNCRGAGVTVCVNKAHQKLYWVKDGQVVKTLKVRTAGWNQDAHGAWRMHATPSGTYSVYKKEANPSSPRYGEGAMPYSTIFDPNMYFHYSSGFASVGYSGSSHGCVNIASKADAKWIMDNTPVGAKVVIY